MGGGRWGGPLGRRSRRLDGWPTTSHSAGSSAARPVKASASQRPCSPAARATRSRSAAARAPAPFTPAARVRRRRHGLRLAAEQVGRVCGNRARTPRRRDPARLRHELFERGRPHAKDTPRAALRDRGAGGRLEASPCVVKEAVAVVAKVVNEVLEVDVVGRVACVSDGPRCVNEVHVARAVSARRKAGQSWLLERSRTRRRRNPRDFFLRGLRYLPTSL